MANDKAKITREKFDSLTAKEQWQWILDNKSEIEMLNLDNDSTDISMKYVGSEDDEDTEMYYLKANIGNREGVVILLELLGIKAESV